MEEEEEEEEVQEGQRSAMVLLLDDALRGAVSVALLNDDITRKARAIEEECFQKTRSGGRVAYCQAVALNVYRIEQNNSGSESSSSRDGEREGEVPPPQVSDNLPGPVRNASNTMGLESPTNSNNLPPCNNSNAIQTSTSSNLSNVTGNVTVTQRPLETPTAQIQQPNGFASPVPVRGSLCNGRPPSSSSPTAQFKPILGPSRPQMPRQYQRPQMPRQYQNLSNGNNGIGPRVHRVPVPVTEVQRPVVPFNSVIPNSCSVPVQLLHQISQQTGLQVTPLPPMPRVPSHPQMSQHRQPIPRPAFHANVTIHPVAPVRGALRQQVEARLTSGCRIRFGQRVEGPRLRVVYHERPQGNPIALPQFSVRIPPTQPRDNVVVRPIVLTNGTKVAIRVPANMVPGIIPLQLTPSSQLSVLSVRNSASNSVMENSPHNIGAMSAVALRSPPMPATTFSPIRQKPFRDFRPVPLSIVPKYFAQTPITVNCHDVGTRIQDVHTSMLNLAQNILSSTLESPVSLSSPSPETPPPITQRKEAEVNLHINGESKETNPSQEDHTYTRSPEVPNKSLTKDGNDAINFGVPCNEADKPESNHGGDNNLADANDAPPPQRETAVVQNISVSEGQRCSVNNTETTETSNNNRNPDTTIATNPWVRRGDADVIPEVITLSDSPISVDVVEIEDTENEELNQHTIKIESSSDDAPINLIISDGSSTRSSFDETQQRIKLGSVDLSYDELSPSPSIDKSPANEQESHIDLRPDSLSPISEVSSDSNSNKDVPATADPCPVTEEGTENVADRIEPTDVVNINTLNDAPGGIDNGELSRQKETSEANENSATTGDSSNKNDMTDSPGGNITEEVSRQTETFEANENSTDNNPNKNGTNDSSGGSTRQKESLQNTNSAANVMTSDGTNNPAFLRVAKRKSKRRKRRAAERDNFRRKTVPKIFEHLYNSNSLDTRKDVVFILGESKVEINAHKRFLSLLSPVFNREFYPEGQLPVPSSSSLVPMRKELLDVEPQIFTLLLKYVYMNTIDNDLPLIERLKLLDLATRFEMNELAVNCKTTIRTMITFDNVLTVLEYGVRLNDERLKELALTYIGSNACSIMATENTQFLDVELPVLSAIFESDKLCCNEILVYEAALRWALNRIRTADASEVRIKIEGTGVNEGEGEEIRKVLGPALYLIRFPLINKPTFSGTISKSNILTIAEKLEIFGSYDGQELSAFSCKLRVFKEPQYRQPAPDASNIPPQNPEGQNAEAENNFEHNADANDDAAHNNEPSEEEPGPSKRPRLDDGGRSSRSTSVQGGDPSSVEMDDQSFTSTDGHDQEEAMSEGGHSIPSTPHKNSRKRKKKNEEFHAPEILEYIKIQTSTEYIGGSRFNNMIFRNSLEDVNSDRRTEVVAGYDKNPIVITSKNLYPVALPNLSKFFVKYYHGSKNVQAFKAFLSNLNLTSTVMFFEKSNSGNPQRLDALWDLKVDVEIIINGINILKIRHINEQGTLVLSRITPEYTEPILQGLKLGEDEASRSLYHVKHVFLEEISISSINRIPVSNLESLVLRKVKGIVDISDFLRRATLLKQFSCDNCGDETINFASDLGFLPESETTTPPLLKKIAIGKAKLECSIPHCVVVNSVLEELYIDNCTIYGDFVESIPKIFPNLRKVKICRNVTVRLVSQLLEISTLEFVAFWELFIGPASATPRKQKRKSSFQSSERLEDIEKVVKILIDAGIGDTKSLRRNANLTFSMKKELDSNGERKWVGRKCSDKYYEFTEWDYEHFGFDAFYENFDLFYKMND